ncbi:hypothetical protein E4U22_002266 [Claviceps purpurea]|nr:hypothetical protein E4U38_000233 [Claviceps purpurea]KAG6124880.1 hypothetical protein E4U12_007818 [Claviceps purpurea]KAG6148909.1 hypothetical protein E4U11_000364 [Claviceps purpurea]KAG6164990.1 hypothetical protein E4U27_008509 [Claviceps purpurea]KAG6224561.1 hypothetical protein E4U34_000214 [Claviceps purpurea]
MFAIRGAGKPARLLVATVVFGGVHAYTAPLRQSMVQLDAYPTSRTGAVPKASNRSSHLKQDTVHQISSGSVAGFLAGVATALLSRTLCIIGSVIVISFYVSSRYGLGPTRMPRFGRVPGAHAIYQAGIENPWFVFTFASTYALSAFMHL